MPKNTRIFAAIFAIAMALPVLPSSAVHAQSMMAGKRMASPPVSATPLSPKERGELTRQFVMKWGAYVERIYKVPAVVWAKRMVPNFVAADSTNFRNALKRDTLEGALAQLNGSGHGMSDNQVIDRLARLPAEPASARPAISPQNSAI